MKAEMKTLVINGKNRAAGSTNSLIRYARRVVRKEQLQDPKISLIKGIVLELEKAV